MPTDVALLSLGSTRGLQHSDHELATALAAAGVSCRMVRVVPGLTWHLRRQITVIDLVEGLAARRAARATEDARAVIVSSATTALLIRRPRVPWALRFDAPTALNRLGPTGAWQRARERRVFPAADVLLPTGDAALEAARQLAAGRPLVRLPIPVDVPATSAGPRTGDAIAYAGWLHKRGIDLLVQAWSAAVGQEARPLGSRLVIAGCDPEDGRRWLARRGIEAPASVEWAGLLPREEWLDRLARARIFVNASRREDYGIAQLEALALGTPLVTVPSPGSYEALPLARRLAPQLVAADGSPPALAEAIRAGLALDDPRYAERAKAELLPYRREAVVEILRRDVLPRLGL